MHWFWRAVIAIGIGSVFGAAWFKWIMVIRESIWFAVSFQAVALTITDLAGSFMAGLIVYRLPMATVSVLAYGLLSRWFGPGQRDYETHCRKCDYILRGITEPRCPECGEAI